MLFEIVMGQLPGIGIEVVLHGHNTALLLADRGQSCDLREDPRFDRSQYEQLRPLQRDRT